MSILITAELKDGTVCQMAPKAFELLLEHNEISRLKRVDGWAVVGRDRFRTKERAGFYSIPERRKSLS